MSEDAGYRQIACQALEALHALVNGVKWENPDVRPEEWPRVKEAREQWEQLFKSYYALERGWAQ